MGFLDNLLKKETRKAISKFVGNAVDNVFDNLNDTINSKMGNNGDAAGTAANNAATVNTSSRFASNDPDEMSCDYERSVICARVEKVAAQEWQSYELRKNISAAEMGAEAGAMDYTYGLYLNGVPMAMILILEKSGYRRKCVHLAHQACRDKGVFCMNLMEHLPNRRSYISEMLRKNVAR